MCMMCALQSEQTTPSVFTSREVRKETFEWFLCVLCVQSVDRGRRQGNEKKRFFYLQASAAKPHLRRL